jgi:glycerophosphoryl diester phosphodiesterase
LTADRFASRFGWPAGLAYPLAIGHRGASAHSQENTLQAFALASDLGADMWELDIQLTRDGVPVVSHDDHLQRVFGLDIRISALSAAELAKLPGAEVPTFSEVAALARERGTGLYVEIKAAGSAIRAWQLLHAASQPFAVLGSFDIGFVRELRDAGCSYPLSVLVPLGADPHQAADACRADIMHLCWERGGERPQELVTEALLARAQRDGRAVVLWHEERVDIIADLVRMPVLGICSDAPELLRRAMSEPA